MIEKFRKSIQLALKAGVDTIEIHGAHGYLIHQFHSPLTNRRTYEFGRDLTKFGCEIIKVAKEEMPENMPLLMRLSGKEYVEGGYDIDDCIRFSKDYLKAGVDIFDVSSGGEGQIRAWGKPGTHAAYQMPLAKKMKEALNVPIIAVGRLDDPLLANLVIGNHEADIVAVGRGMLRNPYWALESAKVLQKESDIPRQYTMGF